MKKIMLVFGTRPEAIKMCPVAKALSRREEFCVRVTVTGQHRELLDGVLSVFDVKPDHDLAVMKEGQTLTSLTSEILTGMARVLEQEKPDLVLVHGDTTTSFATGLAAFYHKIPVGHVEAGLRTGDIYAPFPEEFNRLAVGDIAAFHFAPTETARAALLGEGKPDDRIFVTGNTAIDALKTTVREDFSHPILDFSAGRRIILLTAHRRENHGEGLSRIFTAIKRLAAWGADLAIIYPVHPSPAVKEPAYAALSDVPNVLLTEPLSVVDFHNIMARSTLVLTDSGGAQEEAPYFGVPVLVMRDVTERPEGLAAGTARLVGTDALRIEEAVRRLLTDPVAYAEMAKAVSPYGDGTASEKIAEILAK